MPSGWSFGALVRRADFEDLLLGALDYFEQSRVAAIRRPEKRNCMATNNHGQCLGWPYFPEWHSKTEVLRRRQIATMLCESRATIHEWRMGRGSCFSGGCLTDCHTAFEKHAASQGRRLTR
jgi:hypothetical protein